MNSEIKQKWIDALRSGEYSQGAKKLRVEKEFCCLGVLCDLYQKEHPNKCSWEQDNYGSSYFVYNNFESTEELCLPKIVMEWAGLDDSNPNVVFNKEMTAISNVNDSGANFKTIAKIIEDQL